MPIARTLLVALGLIWSAASMAQAPVWCWATAIRGAGYVHTQRIAESTTNGCYVSGSFGQNVFLPFDTLEGAGPGSNYFVLHLDTLGSATWAAQFTDPVVSMQALASGGVSCMVLYEGTTSINGQVLGGAPSGYSAAVAEFDMLGTMQLLVNMPGLVVGNTMTSPAVHHDPVGGVALMATIQDSLSVMGSWVYGAGIATARVSPLGEFLWAQSISGYTESVEAVHVAASGEVLTCAVAEDSNEPEVISFDPNGTVAWTILVELGWGPLDPPVMARRPNGSALIATVYHTQAPIGAGTILTVSEVDPNGDLLWATSTTGATNWGNDIKTLNVLPNGDALVGGYLIGYLNFGGFSLQGGGPGGFAAIIGPSGAWQWGVTQTSGNVFGAFTAPGTNSRIYFSGSSDTNTSFGGHQLQQIGGNMYGIVACLGDVTLSSPEHSVESSAAAWPNPTSDQLTVQLRSASPMRILDTQGRVVQQAQGLAGLNTIDVRELRPGPYAITAGELVTRFVKE